MNVQDGKGVSLLYTPHSPFFAYLGTCHDHHHLWFTFFFWFIYLVPLAILFGVSGPAFHLSNDYCR